MPSTVVPTTVASPARGSSRASAGRSGRVKNSWKLASVKPARLVGDRVVEDAHQRVDEEEDQEEPDEPRPRAGSHAAGPARRERPAALRRRRADASRIRPEAGKAELQRPRWPTRQRVVVPRVADIDLEDEPGRRLDVVAQRIAEIRGERHAPADDVAVRRAAPAAEPRATFSGRMASTQRSPTAAASAGRPAQAPDGGARRRAPRRAARAPPRRRGCWCRRSRPRSACAGRSYSSLGAPTWSTRPSFITATRSESDSASSWSWVT